MIYLADLCPDIIPCDSKYAAVTVHGITQDSRSAVPGSLFLAFPGLRADGRDYIAAAIEKGASVVLYENNDAWQLPASTIYAVYPGNRLMSMKVRAFVDHLARCFGRTPYWDQGL